MRAAVARLKTTDPQIPEMVRDLLLSLLEPEPKPPRVVHRIHRCTCCEAVWDEDVDTP